MRLLYCGSGWLSMVDRIRVRLAEGQTIAVWDRAVPLVQAVRDVQVILPSNARIDADAIRAAADLRLIQQPAAGIDGVDLAAARERGVPVCNAPGVNHVSVAETALFLILALARRLPRARAAFQARQIGTPPGVELRGKRLGIVGLGRSGRALADAARGLGMQVDAVRSADPRSRLLDLLRSADVISLHCPLTDATRGLLDREAFAAMKPGALLVNVARGPIVDRPALEEALGSGHLAGLGLDVYWREPWDPTDPLLTRDDVVTLPHVAGATEESLDRIADLVAANVAAVARGEPPAHQV